MIRPLRRRHAVLASLMLALLAPVGLVAGVLGRPEEAVVSGLPRAVLEEHGGPEGRIDETSLTVEGIAIAVRTWGPGPSRFLQLAPEDDVRLPDVLVYWTPGTAVDPNAPPPGDAVLVGSLGGAVPRVYPLPPAAADGGCVLLYSLAHKRGVGSASLKGNG